jgi:peptidoglycan/LPS O-acetylase OafA/YrhL
MTAVLVGSILAATASHYLVERPIVNAVGRWAARKNGTTRTAATAQEAYTVAGPR